MVLFDFSAIFFHFNVVRTLRVMASGSGSVLKDFRPDLFALFFVEL
jgi:hypothetical protein